MIRLGRHHSGSKGMERTGVAAANSVVPESSLLIAVRSQARVRACVGVGVGVGVHDGNGTLVRFDDNWRDDSTQAGQIALSGVAPTNLLESAMAVTLTPGNYTAIVRGKNNGSGVALFEACNIQ